MAKKKARKSTKVAKSKITRTAKRKSTAKRRRSGSSFEIDRVPNLI